MRTFFSRFWKDKSAATGIEYGLIAGATAAMLVLALLRVGPNLSAKFNTVASQFTGPSIEDQTGSIMDIKRAQRVRASSAP
jgi:Flp pilus assembly pilin Flp